MLEQALCQLRTCLTTQTLQFVVNVEASITPALCLSCRVELVAMFIAQISSMSALCMSYQLGHAVVLNA